MKIWHPEEIELLKTERFQPNHTPIALIQIQALLQLALGVSFEKVSEEFNRPIPMLESWLEMYDEEGLHNLLHHKFPVPTPALDRETTQALAQLLENIRHQKQAFEKNIRFLGELTEDKKSFIKELLAGPSTSPQTSNLPAEGGFQEIQEALQELESLQKKQKEILQS